MRWMVAAERRASMTVIWMNGRSARKKGRRVAREVMRKKFLVLVALLAFGIALSPRIANADAINLALKAQITATGHYHGSTSTLIDGIFLPTGTDWRAELNTVWWTGTYNPGVSFEINFGGVYEITSLIVQADNNDVYRVSYWDMSSSTWKTAWDVPTILQGFGMHTRPDPDDNSEQYLLPNPVTTNMIQLTAVSGDGDYALSEIQAFGTPVPIPGNLLLFGPGLVGLAAVRRRLKK